MKKKKKLWEKLTTSDELWHCKLIAYFVKWTENVSPLEDFSALSVSLF